MAYTETEQSYIDDLRQQLADDDADKNILNGKKQAYSDSKLFFFINQALRDLNAGSPVTRYTLDNFPDRVLLLNGALIFAFMSEGILQLRNQIDYSDAGLSVGIFNKTGGYQGWAGFVLQTYASGKMQFKRNVWATTPGAGFIGIMTGFHQDYGRW